MALRTINLGSVANDGTGDDLREAFEKVIFNFNELDARTPEETTAINLGAGAGIFASINDAELQFKSLIAGTNVTLDTTDSDVITVNVDAGVTQFVIASDSGSLTVTENNTVTIEGGRLISTERDGSSIRINSSALGRLEDDSAPRLAAGLDANGYNLANVGTIDATTVSALFNGNLTGLVHGIDIRDLNYYRIGTNSWNLGGINPPTVTNLWDYLYATLNIDLGPISNNGSVDTGTGDYVGSNSPLIDLGTIVSPN